MIALEMMGPTNEDALPTMLKREKKRYSLPRGMTSEIYSRLRDQLWRSHALLPWRRHDYSKGVNTHHGLRIAIPGPHHEPVPDLV